MTLDMQTAILTTVNAPYQQYLDAGALSAALKNGDIALGQVTSFFTEVTVEAQKAFAQQFGIPLETLVKSASAFVNWSGQDVALVA